MPKVIATRSIANEPISALLPLTNVKPSRIALKTGGWSVSVGAGGNFGSAVVTPIMTTKPAAWAAYALPMPSAAIITPPSAGPTTAATW